MELRAFSSNDNIHDGNILCLQLSFRWCAHSAVVWWINMEDLLNYFNELWISVHYTNAVPSLMSLWHLCWTSAFTSASQHMTSITVIIWSILSNDIWTIQKSCVIKSFLSPWKFAGSTVRSLWFDITPGSTFFYFIFFLGGGGVNAALTLTLYQLFIMHP